MISPDLAEKYIDFILKTVKSILPEVKIFIFGSRVQGKALEYSDVDIALQDKQAIPISDILKIKSAFHDSTFPYKVDIVDINSIDEKFLSIIKNDLIEIG